MDCPNPTPNVVTEDPSVSAVDCLFVVGGEGTLEIGYKFQKKGVQVIGIPKTIDNDLDKTDYTFGYQTAVQVACEALD